MVVLITGGRRYRGDVACLDQLNISLLIHGDADGADRRAAAYCRSKGIHVAAVPALWEIYSNPAGSKRNSAMLLLKPDYCVAFPGGKGTADMVKKCECAGIPVWKPYG